MNLQHHFLIAMPTIRDQLFRHSVIYVCEHNAEGAMGLIVNKPAENLTIETVLRQLKIAPSTGEPRVSIDKPVFAGGPLAEDRGFILHSAPDCFAASVRISDNTVITTSRDVLETLGTARQPQQVIVALGYCGWESDQLEDEIRNNIWLTIPANSHILFQTPIAERWREAARSIGVDIHNITSEAGHA